ncbi:hypothetical protein [Nocardia sp. NBC_00416]|uniref:hypothetical protein n=1 Tax=Nocardia sp. NBC_00416 TaxID=2975991 RepID=UPI002E229CA1
MTPDDLIDTIIGALEACHGVRPATPLIGEPAVWWPRDTRKYAVDLHSAIVQIRIVATAMPLPPLLEQVAADIRPLLAGTPWEDAELRLVVTELDSVAVTGSAARNESPPSGPGSPESPAPDTTHESAAPRQDQEKS